MRLAMDFCRDHGYGGVVFKLKVDLGRCKEMLRSSDPLRHCWQDRGYDSAWFPKDVIRPYTENCVLDPGRIVVLGAFFGKAAKAAEAGYYIEGGRVVKKSSKQTGPPTEFYHGTSLEAALTIQEKGFDVDLSGSNAGAMLGPGVYITTSLQKALNCKRTRSRNPCASAFLTSFLGQMRT